MKVTEAISKVEDNKDVQELKSQGYQLGSCFTMSEGKEWTLHFFNNQENKIANVEVKDDINIGKQDELSTDMNELKSQPKISLEKALEKAKNNCALEINKTVCILHEKENLEWSITFFSNALSVHSFTINAKTGKIEKENQDSLLQMK